MSSALLAHKSCRTNSGVVDDFRHHDAGATSLSRTLPVTPTEHTRDPRPPHEPRYLSCLSIWASNEPSGNRVINSSKSTDVYMSL